MPLVFFLVNFWYQPITVEANFHWSDINGPMEIRPPSFITGTRRGLLQQRHHSHSMIFYTILLAFMATTMAASKADAPQKALTLQVHANQLSKALLPPKSFLKKPNGKLGYKPITFGFGSKCRGLSSVESITEDCKEEITTQLNEITSQYADLCTEEHKKYYSQLVQYFNTHGRLVCGSVESFYKAISGFFVLCILSLVGVVIAVAVCYMRETCCFAQEEAATVPVPIETIPVESIPVEAVKTEQ